jgi:hypothetical protein
VARPLTRTQAAQNRAFLKALRKAANVRLACRQLGLTYGTMQHRRSKHPAFAHRWDAELTFAHARLNAAGRQGPKARAGAPSQYRTAGGEPVVVRRKDGKLQMRAAQPGKLTRECEQAFLSALSVNVRLSAAAAGASARAFSRRKRQNPAFAREMRMAIARGYERLELALIESRQPASHEHDDWRSNDPPAMPPMTVCQALQLMYLHQKEARLLAEPDHIKRRRGESVEAHSFRLTAMYEARRQRAREAFDVAEAERRERGEPSPFGPGELPGSGNRRAQDEPFGLPDLAQVTEWSNAELNDFARREILAEITFEEAVQKAFESDAFGV